MRQRSSCDTGSSMPAGAVFFAAGLRLTAAFFADVFAVVFRVAMGCSSSLASPQRVRRLEMDSVHPPRAFFR
jgi:hypothetical protein